MIARHCRIYGQVQGVGYRQSMQQMAMNLALTGWVRNRRDGSVEAIVCGDDAGLARMIEWMKQGPAMAKVTQVQVADTECPAQDSFVILPTA